MTACSVPSDTALCSRLTGPAAELRVGLVAHPETPEAVGNPAVDMVIVTEAGCAL